MFVFFVSHKNSAIRSCSSSNGLSAHKFNRPTLTGTTFTATSEV